MSKDTPKNSPKHFDESLGDIVSSVGQNLGAATEKVGKTLDPGRVKRKVDSVIKAVESLRHLP